jgi:hypothetical protein
MVIEHGYPDFDAFRTERAAFHEDPGRVGAVLSRLGELAMPSTATEFEFDGVEFGRYRPRAGSRIGRLALY